MVMLNVDFQKLWFGTILDFRVFSQRNTTKRGLPTLVVVFIAITYGISEHSHCGQILVNSGSLSSVLICGNIVQHVCSNTSELNVTLTVKGLCKLSDSTYFISPGGRTFSMLVTCERHLKVWKGTERNR